MSTYARILGTGSCLPPRRVTNQDLALMLAERGLETSDEWIVSRSGISARHFADDGVLSSDLAVSAAQQALQMAKLTPNDIDLIDRKSTRLNSSHEWISRMPSSA